ncbi:hypothetical protein Dimus_004486 [Dionaea muscipula]
MEFSGLHGIFRELPSPDSIHHLCAGRAEPEIKQRMEETEIIECRRCLLPIKTANRGVKRLRCPRCHAEIPLQKEQIQMRKTNYYAIQGSNQLTRTQRENSDQTRTDGSYAGWYSASKGSSGAASPSNMTSTKRALICGVSYNKQKYELKGTINDVHRMKDFLLHQYGFPEHVIRVLAEEDGPGILTPTRKNMEEGLKWLVEGCKPGDSLVFYFSGHGLQQPDFVFDELDGYDETICPVDFATKGMILDNDINAMIVRPLKKGVTLHAIIDACHSGTVLDLQHVYNQKQDRWMDNHPPNGANKGTSGGKAFCLSACHDDQIAVDTTAFTKTGMTGAMTYCLIDAVTKDPNLSYIQLLNSMEETIAKAYKSRCISSKLLDRLLHRHFLQEPQLSCSEKFDVNTRFKL